MLAVKEIFTWSRLGPQVHITGQMHLCVQTAFDAPLVFIRGHMEHITAALTVRRLHQNEQSRPRLGPSYRLPHGFFDKHDCALQRATGRPVHRKFDLGTMTWLDGSGPIDVHINLPNATYPRVSAYDYGPHIG
jgi:hypothetical protein